MKIQGADIIVGVGGLLELVRAAVVANLQFALDDIHHWRFQVLRRRLHQPVQS